MAKVDELSKQGDFKNASTGINLIKTRILKTQDGIKDQQSDLANFQTGMLCFTD